MKKYCLLFLPFLVLASCQKTQEPPADGTEPAAADIIVAQVGPDVITQQQLDDRLSVLPQADRKFGQTAVGRRNFINLLARERLIALDAKDEKLDQSDVYLTAMEDKRQQLKDIYEEYGNQLLGRLWEQSLAEKGLLNVTDEDISAYYDKYPYEMTIKQIIISDAQTADAVYRELRRAKSRWNTLEKQYSTAPDQSKGKEITFMPGEFIPELEVIAANSPTGSVQGFVKTAQGFHIIMKTREHKLTLKEAAPRIRTVLENQKIDAVLNALQNKYKVVIYEEDE